LSANNIMSQLTIFDKFQINQEFDSLPVDTQFEFTLSALRATPTILASIIATTHPCDVEAALKKPLEILVLTELYFQVPGLSKKVFENTLHCLDGTIPAEVEILSGGAIEPTEAELEAELRREDLKLAVSIKKAQRAAAEAAQAVMERRKNGWSKATKEELKAIFLATLTTVATCAMLYGFTALAVSVGAGVTAGSAGAAVGATQFVAAVANDKVGAAATAAVGGVGALTGAAASVGRKVFSALISPFSTPSLAIAGPPVPEPEPTPFPIPDPSVQTRASEAIYSAERVTVKGAQSIVNVLNTLIFSAVNEETLWIGGSGFFVMLAIMYYFLWRGIIKKGEAESFDDAAKMITATSQLNAPTMPRQLAVANAAAPAALPVAPAPLLLNNAAAPGALPAAPVQQPLALADAPAEMPVAQQPQPPREIGIEAPPPAPEPRRNEPRNTNKKGGSNHPQTSLPTRRAGRSSSSSKRNYTHRRRALQTGKVGYRPTKTGRKV
jgi:hypothetical protein